MALVDGTADGEKRIRIMLNNEQVLIDYIDREDSTEIILLLKYQLLTHIHSSRECQSAMTINLDMHHMIHVQESPLFVQIKDQPINDT